MFWSKFLTTIKIPLPIDVIENDGPYDATPMLKSYIFALLYQNILSPYLNQKFTMKYTLAFINSPASF